MYDVHDSLMELIRRQLDRKFNEIFRRLRTMEDKGRSKEDFDRIRDLLGEIREESYKHIK